MGFKKHRYTERDLIKEVDSQNRQLEEAGISAVLHVAPRNGYCGVDCYSNKDLRGDCRNLILGSPRECREEVMTFVTQQKFKQLKERSKTDSK